MPLLHLEPDDFGSRRCGYYVCLGLVCVHVYCVIVCVLVYTEPVKRPRFAELVERLEEMKCSTAYHSEHPAPCVK